MKGNTASTRKYKNRLENLTEIRKYEIDLRQTTREYDNDQSTRNAVTTREFDYNIVYLKNCKIGRFLL